MNTDHEVIAEFLESARYMPADLQRDPSGLLRVCLRIMREHGDDPMALSHMLEAAMDAAAARRRAALARWNESYERIVAVRPRCDEERLARHEALELMERARP